MGINQTYRFPFASYPAVRIVLLMALGITLDYQLNLDFLYWGIIFALSSVMYILGEYIYQKSLKSLAYNVAICCYLLMTIGFGGAWHSLFDTRQQPTEAKVINTYTWKDLTFNGTVQQIKQTSTGKYQVDVEVDTTLFPNELTWPKPYTVRAVLDPADHSKPEKLRIGNDITFSATIYPLEEKRNPSQFDYKGYLASQGIYTQVGIQEIHSITSQNNIVSWTYLRRNVLEAIDNNFSKQTESLAKALLIGYKNELDRQEKITFSRAGLSHIMAVSGLHVGFILAPFWIMIPFIWTLRYGKEISLSALIVILYLYAGLTGFSASVTRASLVGILLTYGKLFHKVRNSKNLTAVAALIILLVNPSDLFTIGFQLSFGAVYVILLTAPVIQRWLPDWIRFRWIGKPVMVVVISFIVQIGLFPLLAYYFGEFSIVGPLANAFVVPILGIAVPYGLFLLLVAMPFPEFAKLLNIPVDFFLQQLSWFVETSASLPWSWIQVHIDSILFFGIWIAGILLIASLPIPKMRWKLVSIFLFLLCLDQGTKAIQKLQPSTLRVTFFDVGQGDAALVTTPHNKHFLIDTGRWEPDYNSAKYIIMPHLKEQGIDKLDAVFLTHPHADHIGGMPELLRQIPIDTIYNSGTNYDSKLYQKYHRLAHTYQTSIKSISAGNQIPVDPAIRLFAYGPENSASSSNANNRSLVLELVYGKTEFLFMGDAETAQEERLLSHYPRLLNTDFLKVGHHGSKTSSTSQLLEATTAQTGVVSLGKNNHFEHPHKEAVRRLRATLPELYFTSLNGALSFYSNGQKIYRKY